MEHSTIIVMLPHDPRTTGLAVDPGKAAEQFCK